MIFLKAGKIETKKIIYFVIAIIGVAAAVIALTVNMHLIDLNGKTENSENTWYSDKHWDCEFVVKVSAVDESYVKNMGCQALKIYNLMNGKELTGNSIVSITKLDNLKYNANDIIYPSDYCYSDNTYSGFFVPKDCVSASVDGKEFPIETGKVILTDGTEYEFKVCMIYYSTDKYYSITAGNPKWDNPKLHLTDSKGEEHIIYDNQ